MHNLNSVTKVLLAALLGTSLAARTLAADTLPALEHIPEEPKREWTAYAAAIGATVAPVVLGSLVANWGSNEAAVAGFSLIAGGLLIGPSTGQFYAGSTGHGIVGSGIRALGGLMLITGAVNSVTSMSCLEREAGEPACDDNSGAGFIAILGALTYFGGTVYSLTETHYAVQRTRLRVGNTYGFTPILALAGDGATRLGGQAWLRF